MHTIDVKVLRAHVLHRCWKRVNSGLAKFPVLTCEHERADECKDASLPAWRGRGKRGGGGKGGGASGSRATTPSPQPPEFGARPVPLARPVPRGRGRGRGQEAHGGACGMGGMYEALREPDAAQRGQLRPREDDADMPM